jgi:putative MFS transporter
MLPHLRAEFGLSSAEVGLIGGAAPVGMIAGAALAGLIGDRFGRKSVMLYALLLFCAASISLAFATRLVFILIVRVIGGLGAGAEAAIVSPYISEFATGRNRGRFVSGVTLFFSLGNVVAAILGSLVVPMPNGWRIAAVICGLPVLVLLRWRARCPSRRAGCSATVGSGGSARVPAADRRLRRLHVARHDRALPV